jgi:hypothetical protein
MVLCLHDSASQRGVNKPLGAPAEAHLRFAIDIIEAQTWVSGTKVAQRLDRCWKQAYNQTDGLVCYAWQSQPNCQGRRESAMKRILAVGVMVAAAVVPFAPEVLGIGWG